MWRPRWRTDAHGYVARFAGQWASGHTWDERADLERVVQGMPNGDQVEIVEVPA